MGRGIGMGFILNLSVNISDQAIMGLLKLPDQLKCW